MPRYLVTGADGFIGSRLVRRLVRRGETSVLVRPRARLTRLTPLEGEIQIHHVDIRDAIGVEDAVRRLRPTAVFHLAAAGTRCGVAPDEVATTNVLGTQNVLAAIRAADSVESAVFVGSWYEYGMAAAPDSDGFPRPTTPYGISKLAATLLVQALASRGEVPAVVMRPFQVYGPAEPEHRLIPYILCGAREGAAARLQNLDSLRDWVYVDDVAEALESALEADLRGQVIDVGTGVATSVRDVASMVLALVGSARGTEQDPSVARSIESGDARLSGAADTHGAHELLGWSAKHDLAAGLSRAVEWHLKENGRLAAP